MKALNCFKTPVATRPVRDVTSQKSLNFDKTLSTNVNIEVIRTPSAPKSNLVSNKLRKTVTNIKSARTSYGLLQKTAPRRSVTSLWDALKFVQ